MRLQHPPQVHLSVASEDPERLLFGEAPSRAVVTLAPDDLSVLQAASRERGVPCPWAWSAAPRADPSVSIPVETLLARHHAPLPGL